MTSSLAMAVSSSFRSRFAWRSPKRRKRAALDTFSGAFHIALALSAALYRSDRVAERSLDKQFTWRFHLATRGSLKQ